MAAREVHNYDRGSINRNDGECKSWRGSLGIVHCYNWGQASLCTGPHALLHLPLTNLDTRNTCDDSCLPKRVAAPPPIRVSINVYRQTHAQQATFFDILAEAEVSRR